MRYLILFIFFISLLYAEKISLETLKNEPRIAYIIGNGDYEDSPLDMASSNAQQMKTFLQDHNFEVLYKEDASKRDIIRGLRQFSTKMKPNGISLFYFCGHMIQVKGENYLIPIDAAIDNDYHVLYEAISLNAILSKMQKSRSRLNIIIIDSGYKNPFGDRFRAKEKGFAKLRAKDNQDVILSVQPNKTVKAYPFTTKLIPILSLDGISNKEAFKTFSSRYKQSFIQNSKEDFYFKVPKKLKNKEEVLWMKTIKLNSIASYSSYLLRFPKGSHAKQARLDLTALRKKEEAQLKLKKELQEKAKKDTQAKEALEVLKATQALALLKENAQLALLQTQAKEKENLAIQAAIIEEKRLAKENTNYIEPVMTKIKAGSFIMGSGRDNDNEKPKHSVHIKNDFYIGKFEVTNFEYKAFLTATKRTHLFPPNWTTNGQPVIGVSWDDATAYAAWLSDLTDKKYRLPTEEEWEYVARAGADTRYYWGDEDTSDEGKSFWKTHYPKNAHNYAWIKTNSLNTTHTVGLKTANSWGLFDVIGNVSEWCLTPYSDDYVTSVDESNVKVIRGGSWFSVPTEITLSHRRAKKHDFKSYNIGFRLLREK